MSQDALSDLLRCVRLRGALFFHVDCGGRWVSEAPDAKVLTPLIMPEAQHLMGYHAILRGGCWAGLATDGPPIRLSEGDVVVFPHGDAHVMSSVPGLRAEPDVDFLARRPPQLPFLLRQEGDRLLEAGASPTGNDSQSASTTTLLCGFWGCDRGPFNPLLGTLPRMIHAPSRRLGEESWIGQFVRLAAAECRAKRPGGEAALERMSEMMFIDVLRRHLETLPEDQTGWLAALRDRYVGRALCLLHERPGAPWTLERLSASVGLSRSALHDRFVRLLEQPPMQYLTAWRMQLASRLLTDSNAMLASIALKVGYESEAAFSRAFKRAIGLPPAAWRRQRASAGVSPCWPANDAAGA